MVKWLPAMPETQVRSLGQENHLEKEMATHFSTHAWKIPWMEEPSRLQPIVSQSQTPLSNFTFTFTRPTPIIHIVTGLELTVERSSLVAQRLKRLPAMLETWVWSLGPEDPLEKKMATHSSILAWRIPWMEEPAGLQVHGVAKSQTRLSDFTFTSPDPNPQYMS